MHKMDSLIFKTKFQIENELPTTSQLNYHLENLRQNILTASYNFPTSIHSASSYYFQPSFSQHSTVPKFSEYFTYIWSDYR